MKDAIFLCKKLLGSKINLVNLAFMKVNNRIILKMKNLKYTIIFIFFTLKLNTTFACCGAINFNLISVLHSKEYDVSALLVVVDSAFYSGKEGYKSYCTVIQDYKKSVNGRKIEVYSGGNTSAGGSLLVKNNYYFVVGNEFQIDKFGAFVCDAHSRKLSDNPEDSSYVSNLMTAFQVHKNQKYTGIEKYFFQNNTLMAEGKLKNGLPNGKWKYYGRDSNLIAEVTYKMGLKIGKMKEYTLLKEKTVTEYLPENGEKIMYYNSSSRLKTIEIKKKNKEKLRCYTYKSYNFKGKTQENRTQLYDFKIADAFLGNYEMHTLSGKLVEKGKYDRGAKVGKWLELNDKDSSLIVKIYPKLPKQKQNFVWYFPDRKKKMEGDLSNGLKQNIWIEYKQNGDTLSFGKYENSKEVGLWKYFDEKNTRLNRIVNFKNGILHGSYVSFYNENGKIYDEGNYLDGNQVGLWKAHFLDGSIARIENYNSIGERHGTYIIYFKSGKIQSISDFENGNRIGKYVEYFDNGNVRESGIYVNDFKLGDWSIYEVSGKLRQKCTYSVIDNMQSADCENR